MGCKKLPDVGMSRVFGLLEIVHDNKDAVSTARVAMDLDLELDELLPVLEAAELLDFVEIKSGKIVLTKQGKSVISGSIDSRVKVFKKQLSSLKMFKSVVSILEKKKRVKKRSLVKYCQLNLPKSEAEKTVERIIGWGQYAKLIGYDGNREELYKV